MTRRAGRRHKIVPKMWIRCGHCGQTLSFAVAEDSRFKTYLKFDDVERINVRTHYNSNRGSRYQHGKNQAFMFDETYTFRCEFGEHGAPGLAQRPTPEERDEYRQAGLMLATFRQRSGRAVTIDPDVEHPDDQLNPARYTPAGNTPRPRDVKREKRRCNREHQVRRDRILAHWNELASVDETTPGDDIRHIEKRAYLAAGKHWVMTLV